MRANVMLAVIQARFTGTRLPGKVMMSLAGKSLIEHVYARTVKAFGEAAVCIAIPKNNQNALLWQFLYTLRLPVIAWNGPENDVLGRIVYACEAHGLEPEDLVMRVTPDDPFKDPEMMRRPKMPVEVSCEGWRYRVLKRWNTNGATAQQREHLTYLKEDKPPALPNGWRWTIDTQPDLDFARAVYERLYPTDPYFGFDAVARLMLDPEIAALHEKAKAAA